MTDKTTAAGAAAKPALVPAPAKAIEPETLFEQFDRIYNSIANRAFEIFDINGQISGRDLENWFQAESELLHPVKINMTETKDAVSIQAEVPGFTAKDVEVGVDGDQLTISGKRETQQEQKDGKAVYREHCSNEILRVITLPAEVNVEAAKATLKNGILELQLPKTVTEAKKAIRVEVKQA